ncbi:hypothetical protein EBT31_13830 [bacterium]|jgi:hypothetical protein|nr:hypothetical protein [bacterium]
MGAENMTGANGMRYRYTDFISDVIDTHKQFDGHWALGKCFFNVLRSKRPALAEQLRSSPLDPFHKTELSDELHAWMRDNW